MIGIILGVILGVSLAAYVTLRLLCRSNEHGNSYGGFEDLSENLGIIEIDNNVSKNDYILKIRIKRCADKQKEKEKEYLDAVGSVGKDNNVNKKEKI